MINFNKAEFTAAAGISSQLPESGKPEVIFSGRSNVGKSSLINKLVNRKSLARVSATPGKTATINFLMSISSVLLICLAMVTQKYPIQKEIAGLSLWRDISHRIETFAW